MREVHRESSVLTESLLQAGRVERPKDDARKRAATAIGLAGTLAATATAGGAAGGATGTAAASKWLGSMGLFKLLGAVVAGGVFVVGAVSEPSYVAGSGPVASPPPKAAHALARPASAAHAMPVPPVATATEPIETATPVAPVVPMAGTKSNTHRAARVATDDDESLRSEVQLLDHAHAALAAGDAMAALAELRSYDRAFARGALHEEADLIRVQALAQSGDTPGASARAEALLARDPDAPHARRLRAILASLRGDGDVH